MQVSNLVVVFDAHADAVEHDGDQDGALYVTAFNEALDASTQLPHSPTYSATTSSIASLYFSNQFQF